MRIALLVNEASGSGTEPDEIEDALRTAGARPRRVGIERLDEAGRERPERLVVAGGDGSVAPAADAAGRLGIPLALIPTGTANDFARAMGLPAERGEACRLAATGLRLRPLDLARMGARPFVNVASAGLAAGAARSARPLKGPLGPVAYLVAAVRAGLTGRPVPCAVRCDDHLLFEGPAWQVTVACSGAFGGGSRLGGSHPSDGRLDVVVIRAGSRLGLALHGWAMRAGRAGEERGAVRGRGRVVDLRLPPGERVNVDGELVVHSPRLSVDPGWFSLVVG